jgi:hypothetical protein
MAVTPFAVDAAVGAPSIKVIIEHNHVNIAEFYSRIVDNNSTAMSITKSLSRRIDDE